MGETMSQLDILCYHIKHPVPEMEYTLLNYSPEESHRSSRTQQAIGKGTCYSLKPGSKTLLLKIPLTLNKEKSRWSPNRNSTCQWRLLVHSRPPKPNIQKSRKQYIAMISDSYQVRRKQCLLHVVGYLGEYIHPW